MSTIMNVQALATVAVAGAWPLSGYIVRGRASNQHSTLACQNNAYLGRFGFHCRKHFGAIFGPDERCFGHLEVRKTRAPLKVVGIRNTGGRRHHRRRDAELAYQQRPKKDRPAILDMVPQFANSKREEKVVITLDIDQLKQKAADAAIDVQKLAARSILAAQSAGKRSVDRVIRFAKTATQETEDVWKDLRSSVRVQRDKHLVISIRRSSLHHIGKVFVGTFLLVVFVRFLFQGVQNYRWGWGEDYSRSKRVVRDRSLAGKEVSLSKGVRLWEGGPTVKSPKVPRAIRGPLDMPFEDSRSEKDLLKSTRGRGEDSHALKTASRLPGWWPDPDLPPTNTTVSRQRAENEAQKLVQGIMQKRLTGFDFSAEDILQLRQLCKASGSKVKFDTYNTRDSFYRAAVNFVLSACQRAGKYAMAEYGSEGGIRFIAGLATNIGLDSGRAATMVNAAVAARTRAAFLQAKALQLQSKYSESEDELLRLMRLLSYFRPDENSAEMEMVARGLGSHFDKPARTEMLQLYESLGGIETKRVVEEALGLSLSTS